MTNRTTKQHLNNLIQTINKLTNSPATAYTRTETELKGNIGNFYLYQAYGAYGLNRIANEGGGVTNRHIEGLHSKAELYRLLKAFIAGLELAKGDN